jgi:quercetin dioxygenase-like cupin family protein
MKIIRWKKEKGQPSLDMIRGILADEGLRCYTWSDAPGKFYPEHSHDEDEMRWIVQGSLVVGVDGKEIKLKAGDKIELPAGTSHWARVAEDAPIIYICATRTN